MIKIFCDVCGKEIIDRNEIGNFKIQEKNFAFIKHQKQDQMRVQEFIFCVDCARKIREYFSNLKKDYNNVGNTK